MWHTFHQKLQLILLSSTDLLAVVNYSVKEITLHMLIKSQFVFKFFCLELTNLCLYYIACPPTSLFHALYLGHNKCLAEFCITQQDLETPLEALQLLPSSHCQRWGKIWLYGEVVHASKPVPVLSMATNTYMTPWTSAYSVEPRFGKSSRTQTGCTGHFSKRITTPK